MIDFLQLHACFDILPDGVQVIADIRQHAFTPGITYFRPLFNYQFLTLREGCQAFAAMAGKFWERLFFRKNVRRILSASMIFTVTDWQFQACRSVSNDNCEILTTSEHS
jgi:hypothetical protein